MRGRRAESGTIAVYLIKIHKLEQKLELLLGRNLLENHKCPNVSMSSLYALVIRSPDPLC